MWRPGPRLRSRARSRHPPPPPPPPLSSPTDAPTSAPASLPPAMSLPTALSSVGNVPDCRSASVPIASALRARRIRVEGRRTDPTGLGSSRHQPPESDPVDRSGVIAIGCGRARTRWRVVVRGGGPSWVVVVVVVVVVVPWPCVDVVVPVPVVPGSLAGSVSSDPVVVPGSLAGSVSSDPVVVPVVVPGSLAGSASSDPVVVPVRAVVVPGLWAGSVSSDPGGRAGRGAGVFGGVGIVGSGGPCRSASRGAGFFGGVCAVLVDGAVGARVLRPASSRRRRDRSPCRSETIGESASNVGMRADRSVMPTPPKTRTSDRHDHRIRRHRPPPKTPAPRLARPARPPDPTMPTPPKTPAPRPARPPDPTTPTPPKTPGTTTGSDDTDPAKDPAPRARVRPRRRRARNDNHHHDDHDDHDDHTSDDGHAIEFEHDHNRWRSHTPSTGSGLRWWCRLDPRPVGSVDGLDSDASSAKTRRDRNRRRPAVRHVPTDDNAVGNRHRGRQRRRGGSRRVRWRRQRRWRRRRGGDYAPADRRRGPGRHIGPSRDQTSQSIRNSRQTAPPRSEAAAFASRVRRAPPSAPSSSPAPEWASRSTSGRSKEDHIVGEVQGTRPYGRRREGERMSQPLFECDFSVDELAVLADLPRDHGAAWWRSRRRTPEGARPQPREACSLVVS